MKSKLKPITRIKRVMNFYLEKGINKESINELYFKILTLNSKK